jgi:hypothetical protein
MAEHLQDLLARIKFDLKCWHLPEPALIFGHGNHAADPKVGIGLYGPCGDENDRPLAQIRVGIIGTGRTIELAQEWLGRCRSRIVASVESSADPHMFPAFPGVESQGGFGCSLECPQGLTELLLPNDVAQCAGLPKGLAVEKLAKYVSAKLEALAGRERPPDVVLVALPKDLKEIAGERARPSRRTVSKAPSKENQQLTFFDEKKDEETPTGRTLHRAIKGEGMRHGMPTQLVWPGTFEGGQDVEDEATRAWNFCTALYYKAKGMPWRVSGLARNTCYVGISFFKPLREPHLLQTSMAQAFSERGEGVVLRGTNFEWSRDQGEPHLSKEASRKLLEEVLEHFGNHHHQQPGRVVVHKSSLFSQDELDGMEEALNGKIALYDFLSISKGEMRFLRVGDEPPLRGTVVEIADRRYIFYTRGFIPHIGLYPGLRIPRPLDVVHAAGTGVAHEFLGEILALTRMNWNSANFAAAEPITLGFSRKVGLILGELPKDVEPQKYFRFYM